MFYISQHLYSRVIIKLIGIEWILFWVKERAEERV